jgi:Trk K+ transport system NAD-binding subunit
LHEWLTAVPGDTLPPPEYPPTGRWIVCGYGRFGKSVVENLQREHITTTIIEAMPLLTGCDNCIVGSGTEAKTLIEAGVKEATGIVAGTDNDINNLSIVMTAFELNPKLFVVIRKNKRHNSTLFKAFNADITMQPTDIIAHECLAHMISPLLAHFLVLARNKSNDWSNKLISKLVAVVGEEVPETWAVTINTLDAPAVVELLTNNASITLQTLTRDPANREQHMELMPLMLMRHGQSTLAPDLSTPIRGGDHILFCGRSAAKRTLPTLLNNTKILTYVVDGIEIPNSLVWRWVADKLK